MIPTIGRIVHYKLNEQDAAGINQRRKDAEAHRRAHPRDVAGEVGATGHISHVGNRVEAGDVYPATIVRTFGDTPKSSVNLQVHLDGSDTFWATSRHVGEQVGDFAWPERVA